MTHKTRNKCKYKTVLLQIKFPSLLILYYVPNENLTISIPN